MEIEVLYFPGCPNHAPTVSLVDSVARELGITAPIVETEIRNLAEAHDRRFLGSPTVLVQGQDIEPARREDRNFGLSCRMYGGSGVPSRELVMSALSCGTGS